MNGRDPLSPMENFPYLLEHVSTWIDTRIYTSLCKEERDAEPWPNSRVNTKLKRRLFVEAGIHSVLSVTPFIHRWNSRWNGNDQTALPLWTIIITSLLSSNGKFQF